MPAAPEGRTWYVVMGVDPGAPQAEVRAAYLRLARSLHPDRHESGTATERTLAERRMREVNDAWSVLGDVTARAAYDRQLRGAEQTRPTPPPPRSPQSPPWTPTTTAPTEPRVETIWRPSRRPAFFAGTRGTGPQPIQVVVDDDDDDDDMVPMGSHEMFLLRRVPVLIAIAVGLAIFIGTAYIGTTHSSVPTAPRLPTTIACHTVDPGAC